MWFRAVAAIEWNFFFCGFYTVFENHPKCHIWVFKISTNFCLIRIDLSVSGNTFLTASCRFSKTRQNGPFLATFDHLKWRRNSLRSQYWMRLFLWFSNIVFYDLLLVLLIVPISLMILLVATFFGLCIGADLPLGHQYNWSCLSNTAILSLNNHAIYSSTVVAKGETSLLCFCFCSWLINFPSFQQPC